MSDRDEWRQDPKYPGGGLDERASFERDKLGFVRPEDREELRFNQQASVGHPYLKSVAYGALTAAGAYAGIRHFAPQHLQRAQNFLTNQMKQLTQRAGGGSWITRLKNFVTAGPGNRQIAGMLDEDLARDVELAREIFSTQSGYIGNRDQVISSMLQRYASTNPMQVPVPSQYPQQIRALANMPAFQRSAGRLGMHYQDVASRLAEAAVRPDAPTVGETVARALGAFRFPFTQWRPFELMAPTELLRRGPALAKLAEENIRGVPEIAAVAPQGMREAMYMGGRILGVEQFQSAGRSYRVIQARALAEGYRLGRLGSGMGAGAAARMGATIARPMADILGDVPELGHPLQPGQGLMDVWRMPGLTPWQRLQRLALEAGDKFGIGPQYSSRTTFGGRARQISDTLRAAATQASFRTTPIPPGSRQVYGVTPEGDWLRRHILAPLGMARINNIRSADDLSWFERQLMHIGIEPRRTVERLVAGRAVREKVPVGQLVNAAGMEIKRQLPFTKTTAMRGEFYAFKGANQGLQDWFNYHLNRPTWMLQELTGMGLRPGKGPLESLWKIGTRVALPAYFGWQALQYADYKSRRWFGYGPISGPALLYTKLKIEAQKVLDSAGITEKAQEIEDKYPGAIESPLAKGAALVGGPLGGAVLGRAIGGARGGAIGAIAGLAGGLLVGTGITKPAEELRQIYEGEREVPVRADRWWAMGRQPFGGSRIKYWKKHWFAEMMSDYKEKSLYGNRKEAWRGSWLPTPENWFLLKNIYDPYYLENLHFYDRPYPVTSPMFENIPLIGPVAGATVGRLLKPTRYRPYEMPDNAGGPGQSQAEALGLQPYPIQNQAPITKWRMSQLTGETLYRLFDWTGLPGFMIGSAKEAITGRQGWFEDQTLLAASGMMNSSERDYYDRNLGGLLGMTEFFRRFVPRGRRNAIYNPISNVAPEWLPGHRSVFPGDRRGYLDFHSGDPYTAIERGEGRLPGAGYEALNELHSGERGVYDSFDRFKVLADVAPFSDSFKYYRRAVEGMIQQRQLSRQDAERYYQTVDNLDERIESKVSTYTNRFSSGAFASDTVTISRLLSNATFQVHEMPGVTFKLAGIKDRTPIMDSSELGEFKRLKDRMAQLIGQQVEMTWGGPGVETPAIIEGLNQEAIRSGLRADRLTGLGYRAAYGSGGLPAMYEKMVHMDPPAPLDYFRTKWLGVRSPTEEYEQFQVYGTSDTNWSHPFRNYILPWYHSWSGTPTAESIRSRQITEYMDNVRWMKSQRMANMAEDNGNLSLAQEYRHDSRHSLTALQPSEMDYWKNIYSALPPAERPYFNVFAGTTSEEEQERILEAVPSYMRHHYIGMWRRKMPGGEFNSPILQRYAQQADAMAEVPVDVRVAEFFGQYPMPPKDWMGWHPGVDLESVTIKTANQEGIDIHQLGYWESQALRSEQMYPGLEGVDIDQPPNTDERDELMSRMHAAGYTNIQASPTFSTDERPAARMEIRRSRRSFLKRQRSPFNAERYTGGEW